MSIGQFHSPGEEDVTDKDNARGRASQISVHRFRIAQLFHELASVTTRSSAAETIAALHGVSPATVVAWAREFPYEPFWRL